MVTETAFANDSADLELINLSKGFSDVPAVRDVSLSVRAGEWLSLVGPSGCGKSTTLKMIAGFIEPESGSILIRGRNITEVPPYRRNTGMVFQNYALFPHMTVGANLAYGLRLRKLPRDQISRRVEKMLALVRLTGLQARYPSELSGGQQQRVALARAMIVEPDVLLLDEPLSNLDARLREELRVEMALLHRKLGLTTIYVTHDQQEALSMSSRIAVMNAGRLEQVGTPEEIYERPASLFVADFIGNATVLTGVVVESRAGQPILVRIDGGDRLLRGVSHQDCSQGSAVHIVLRAERVRLHSSPPSDNGLAGIVRHIGYYGHDISYRIELPQGVLLSVTERNDRQAPYPIASSLSLEVRPEDCLCLPVHNN